MSRDAAPGIAATPLVTVMITVYNGKKYIDRAVRSALMQTHSAIEVIVVDDASSDGTADHVEEVYGDRVVLLRNGVNLGPSGSRNLAIENASGDWVMQLDGDDWIAPERVQMLLAVAVDMQADIVADDQLLVLDGNDRPINSRFIDNGVFRGKPRFIEIEEFVRRDLGSLKPLIRRSKLTNSGVRYSESVRFGEDFIFLYELMRNGAGLLLISDVLYFLRRGNTGSLTTRRDELFEKLLEVNSMLQVSAVEAGDGYVAKAFDARRKRLQSLRRAELSIKNLRRNRRVSVSESFSVVQKIIHLITVKMRLAALLLCRFSEVRRRMHATNRETFDDCSDRQDLHGVRLEKDCSKTS